MIVKFDGAAWLDEGARDWTPYVKFSLPDEDVFAIDATASPPVQVAGPGGVFTGVGTVLFNMVTNPVSGASTSPTSKPGTRCASRGRART